MLGLFLASLGLSTAVAGTSFLAPVASPASREGHTLRYWTLYLALFGLIGSPLALLELAAPIPIAVAGSASALMSAGLNWLFRETSAHVGLAHLAGTEGRVLLPIHQHGGKVVIQTLADRIELPARTDDGLPLEKGRRVLVAFVENGIASVVDLGPRR